MAGRSNSKLKVLYLWKILKENSDENHPMTAQDLCSKLKTDYDIVAERKSIYSSLEVLSEYGLDVLQATPSNRGYYLEDRLFDEPELLLLIDAVQSANFITQEKSEEIVDTILGTSLSVHEREGFRSHAAYTGHDTKTRNKKTYFHLISILRAIENRKKITVTYLQYHYREGELPEQVKHIHVVTPYALIWQDDCYYLICNISRHDNFMHLRLDRIENVTFTEEEARPCSDFGEYPDGFDALDYARSMYNGFSETREKTPVMLRCSNVLYGEILDRFGDSATLSNETLETFDVRVRAGLSRGFTQWILQFGENMEVLSPAMLRDEIFDHARRMAALYEREKDE